MSNTKTLALRFARSFASGAIALMILIVPTNINSFKDLHGWLSALALAGIVGGISAVIQTSDKAVRMQYDKEVSYEQQ